MDKVISLKDWVPAWVRAGYLTEEEIDTWNADYNQSQLAQSSVASDSHNGTTLPRETDGVSAVGAAEPAPEQ